MSESFTTSLWSVGEMFLFLSLELSVLFLVISFLVGTLQHYVPAEKIQSLLGARQGRGYFMSALLGAITPFCSCSTIPMLRGLLRAKTGFGPMMVFLFSSPLLNPLIIALLFATFGWQVTLFYAGSALLVSIVGGFVLDRLHFDRFIIPSDGQQATACCDAKPKAVADSCCDGRSARPVAAQPSIASQPTVTSLPAITTLAAQDACCATTAFELPQIPSTTQVSLLADSRGGTAVADPSCCTAELPLVAESCCENTREAETACCSQGATVATDTCCDATSTDSSAERGHWSAIGRKSWQDFLDVLPYLLLGIAIGSLIYGFMPTDLIVKYSGNDNWGAIPVAAVIGIPLYIRAEAVIPLSAALAAKGMGMGAIMALIIGSAGASLTEVILLKSMFKTQLVAAFLAVILTMAVLSGTLLYCMGITFSG